ncbi:MAG: hypothetical protein ACNA8G_12540 [Gammaproteobacteria bacterium]
MKNTIELHRQRIPLRLLVLDAAGAVLVAVGVLDLLDTGPQLVPVALRFPGVGIALVVLGSVMMLPVPVWLLRRHHRKHGHPHQRPSA